MPIVQGTFRDYARSRLEREIAFAQSVVAIAGTGPIAETSTLAELVAAEISATGYARCNCRASNYPIAWVEALRQWETPQAFYGSAISGGAILSIRWTALLLNATLWSSAAATVNTTADTIAYPSPAGITPATGDRVIVTGDTLPGGLTAGTIYSLQSVANAGGNTTAKLRAIGSSTDADLATTGSGLRVRNASGEARSFWDLGENFSTGLEWRVLTQFVESVL